jgi:integrase
VPGAHLLPDLPLAPRCPPHALGALGRGCTGFCRLRPLRLLSPLRLLPPSLSLLVVAAALRQPIATWSRPDATGLRRGEALALRWEHLNLQDGGLKVAATLSRVGDRLLITEPKSARSRRTVPLSPALVSLLKAQRAAQAAERLQAGNRWTDSGLVFTTEFGGAVGPTQCAANHRGCCQQGRRQERGCAHSPYVGPGADATTS